MMRFTDALIALVLMFAGHSNLPFANAHDVKNNIRGGYVEDSREQEQEPRTISDPRVHELHPRMADGRACWLQCCALGKAHACGDNKFCGFGYVCKDQFGEGDFCMVDDACLSLNCSGSKCTKPYTIKNGEKCNQHGQCKSKICKKTGDTSQLFCSAT